MNSVKDISKIRKEIDKIDRDIISLIRKRIILARKIGKQKKRNNLGVDDKGRERQVLENVKRQSALRGVNKKFATELFKEIMAETKKNEK